MLATNQVKLILGKPYLCYRSYDPNTNTLKIYGQGVYLGQHKIMIANEGSTTLSGERFHCFEVEGSIFAAKYHPGGFGTKEVIYGYYEGLNINQEKVFLSNDVKIMNNLVKVKSSKMTNKEPLTVFAVSKDRRVTICGRLIEQRPEGFVFNLGIAKRRKTDVLLRKRGNKIARERAIRKPYNSVVLTPIAESGKNVTMRDVVEAFKTTFSTAAEIYATNPLPVGIVNKYKMKSVRDSLTNKFDPRDGN